MKSYWAPLWRSNCKLDGVTRHILSKEDCLPALFVTRNECREYIKEKYGYIAERTDLQAEPYGWQMPIPVKVKVEVSK